MTVSLFIKQFELPCFSSYYRIIMKKDFKFFPREKDRKPENNKPVENVSDIDVGDIKDIEKNQKNNNTWKKKSFNSKK